MRKVPRRWKESAALRTPPPPHPPRCAVPVRCRGQRPAPERDRLGQLEERNWAEGPDTAVGLMDLPKGLRRNLSRAAGSWKPDGNLAQPLCSPQTPRARNRVRVTGEPAEGTAGGTEGSRAVDRQCLLLLPTAFSPEI